MSFLVPAIEVENVQQFMDLHGAVEIERGEEIILGNETHDAPDGGTLGIQLAPTFHSPRRPRSRK